MDPVEARNSPPISTRLTDGGTVCCLGLRTAKQQAHEPSEQTPERDGKRNSDKHPPGCARGSINVGFRRHGVRRPELR
jgi:hypothetical protein